MKFVIRDDPSMIASIDVLEIATHALEPALRSAGELIELAKGSADFIAGALHRSLAPIEQPLVWLGAVPLTRRFVAIYAQWRADGARQGFMGVPGGREAIEQLTRKAPTARSMLDEPGASLYAPTLIDATGELCPKGTDCEAGHGVGPVIDDSRPNPRAQFINIFGTTPDRQQRLLEATYAIMPIARQHDGYLRTALHRSLDGTKVANYGQYERVDQIRGMYFHGRTAKAFGSILFKDVTRPATFFGRPIILAGYPIGTTPRLRCYTVEQVVDASDFRRRAT